MHTLCVCERELVATVCVCVCVTYSILCYECVCGGGITLSPCAIDGLSLTSVTSRVTF